MMGGSRVTLGVILCIIIVSAYSAPITKITIDGNFEDWNTVRKYQDPLDNRQGTVFQALVPDCHDTDHNKPCEIPEHVYNPHVDIIQYAIAHDEYAIYAYFKGAGDISLTSNGPGSEAGRSYIQVAIDMDNYEPTGYCLCEGGYYPTSCGYDMHFELEMYNGSFNTAHYLLHSMQNQTEYDFEYEQQKQGLVSFRNATYHPYTEWVYYSKENPPSPQESARCPDGPHTLPNGDLICFVEDKVNGPFQGVMQFAFSEDKTEVEFSAPYIGFMNLAVAEGEPQPAIKLGDTVTIAMMLETSSQYSVPSTLWSTDGAWPIRGYHLGNSDNCY